MKLKTRFVVVRSNMSGVWFGEIVSQTKQSITLRGARRVYEWDGGRLTCSELANLGPGKGSRICAAVSYVQIDREGGMEVIDCHERAAEAFNAAEIAK